jgi:hypothetical protein
MLARSEKDGLIKILAKGIKKVLKGFKPRRYESPRSASTRYLSGIESMSTPEPCWLMSKKSNPGILSPGLELLPVLNTRV